jgi:hypothetical protein
MAMIRLVTFAASFFALTACADWFCEAEAPLPPMSSLSASTAEPALVVRGPLLAYAVDGTSLDDIHGIETIAHEMAVGGTAVRLRTPPGWTASYAGAVWMQSAEDLQARFVVYLENDHAAAFHAVWYDRDVRDPAVTVSEIHSLDSSRRPLLYTYCRSDDGRCGVVYALLTDDRGRTGSGILVHGSWPAEYDRRLRPVAVAAANGVTLVRPPAATPRL